jgi:hypothetical protein
LIEQQSKNKRRNSHQEGVSNTLEGIAMPSKIDTRTRRVGLGYSSLQELVFQVADKSRRRSNTNDYFCVCGLPLGLPSSSNTLLTVLVFLPPRGVATVGSL